MCKLCNGTHVVRDVGTYTAFIRACPSCGPKPKKQRDAERRILLQRLAEAKARFGMEDKTA